MSRLLSVPLGLPQPPTRDELLAAFHRDPVNALGRVWCFEAEISRRRRDWWSECGQLFGSRAEFDQAFDGAVTAAIGDPGQPRREVEALAARFPRWAREITRHLEDEIYSYGVDVGLLATVDIGRELRRFRGLAGAARWRRQRPVPRRRSAHRRARERRARRAGRSRSSSSDDDEPEPAHVARRPRAGCGGRRR